ncbi:MAG: YigZ family protein [Leucobacter sp.]
MSDAYDTIRGEVEHEIEISRSRFLTRLVRVETEESARAVIAEVRAEHPRARHHCSAFVIGPDSRIRRSNDDGEPSGTAGAPMLEALVASELSDVVAVVTRYFGGVLLGAGGLTRAYRRAVVEAAQRAERVHRAQRTEVAVRCSYEVAGVIEAEARRRGYGVGTADYGEAVLQRYAVAAAEIAPLEALVAEASAGAAGVEVGSAVWVDLDD